jgi:hypothetical protein
MMPINRGVLIGLLAAGFIIPASAQDQLFDQSVPSITSRVVSQAIPPATLTGKERLGRKWMDEQRIDNCNVPIDKRGTRPRPSTCSHASTS